jgi:hypothetical protein
MESLVPEIIEALDVAAGEGLRVTAIPSLRLGVGADGPKALRGSCRSMPRRLPVPDQEDVGRRYRLKELEKEVAALDAQWAAIQAECEEGRICSRVSSTRSSWSLARASRRTAACPRLTAVPSAEAKGTL